jgi:hypothetical protein
MPLASDLNALCDWLHARISLRVALGRPDESLPGLYIWPWRVLASPAIPAEGAAWQLRPHIPPLNVCFLLVNMPAVTPEGLSNLESAQQALFDHPVFDTDGAQFQVLPDTDTTIGDLTAIFTAAKLELTICLAYVLRRSAFQPGLQKH